MASSAPDDVFIDDELAFLSRRLLRENTSCSGIRLFVLLEPLSRLSINQFKVRKNEDESN